MVSSGRQTILCLLLFLSVVITAQAQNAVDKTLTSTISGKVTVGNKGLSGVVVGLAISDQFRSNFRATRFRSITDEEGNYRITKVPAGTYEVIVAAASYVPAERRRTLLVGKNETLENVDITLERGGVITGKVTDAEGRPVIEETIQLFATTSGPRPPYFRTIRTDDRGIYRAYGIPAGSYKVSAGREATNLVGSRQNEGGYQRTYHPSTVDPAAAFVIDVSEGSEATNVDITFAGPVTTYSARGRIIDIDTNQPVPNAQVGVQIFNPQYTSAMGKIAESNKDGEFKVEKLPPGKYSVFSEPPADSDWHSEAVDFVVTDRDVEGLLIKTSRGASVSGVVTLEGTDDPNVRASLFTGRIVSRVTDGYVGRSDPSAAINPNGSFRLTGLAPGRLTLNLQTRETFRIIRLERNGFVYPRDVEVREREQITGLRVVVGYANGTIRGVITLPTDFQLPSTARVRVVFRRTEDVMPGNSGFPIEVDARGNFRIEGLIPGTYFVIATVFSIVPNVQPPNLSPVRQTVVVTNGAVADVTIPLQMPPPRPQ